jgi:hypothetical protein
MQIEDQVTNLELSRRLKELGVKQRSIFWWIEEKDRSASILHHGYPLADYEWQYSAFTVAELGILIPEYFDDGDSSTNWGKCEKGFYAGCDYYKDNPDKVGWLKRSTKEFHDRKEADARAKLLIYLI